MKKIVSQYEGVYVENLGWVKSFVEAGLKVYGGGGLNGTNSQSLEVLKKMGIIVVEPSMELELKNRLVMVLEYPLKATSLRDPLGREYNVNLSHYGDKTRVFKQK